MGGNLIKISQEHPSILQDVSVAFPRQIVRLRGSRQDHRYDLIVMQKAAGRGLGQVIQEKWRAGRIPELMAMLEKVGECLGDFHQRYGGKQHGDLTPTNVFYDEKSNCVTFIDLGGMGTSSSESDIAYFSKSLSLSARLMGQQLEIQGVSHFKQGHAKATVDPAKISNQLCASRSIAKIQTSLPTRDVSTAKHTMVLGACRVVSSNAMTSQRRPAPYPALLLSPRVC